MIMTRHFATEDAETFSSHHTLVQRYVDVGPGQNSVQVLETFDNFTFETVDYSNSPTAVFIDMEKSVQHGGFAEGDVLNSIFEVTGSDHDDIIRGLDSFVSTHDGTLFDTGINVLVGGHGNDILEGRGGADTLDGGPDSDTASYESSPSAVHVTVNDPTTGAFLASGGDATNDTLISIENLTGSAFDDFLTGASNDNVFIGGLGNDTIVGGGGNDTVDYSTEHLDHAIINLATGGGAEFKPITADHTSILVSTDHLFNIANAIGTSGDDQIFGSSVDNVLDGGLGNDLIDGGGGLHDTASFISWDSLAPGSGSGLSLLMQSTSITLGEDGHDGSATRALFSTQTFSFQTVEHDTLRNIENVTGSNLSETITGNLLDNVIDGRGGDDIIDSGGGGKNFLDGGDGNNTVSFASRGSFATAGEFISISLGHGDGFGIASDEAPAEIGTGGNVFLELDSLRNFTNVIGSDRGEQITGNEDGNALNGRGGNDTLIGGAGADILTGGSGHDNFQFLSSSESHFGAGQFDTITDFEQGIDKIDFHLMDANTGLPGKQTFIFDTGSGPLDVGHVHASFDAIHNVTVVEANTIGQGHALDFHLELTGHINLTASDFLF
jgi:Ca2+-binding RTX toxin-like protein